MNRRTFLTLTASGLVWVACDTQTSAEQTTSTTEDNVPHYLKDYAATFRQNPRAANLEWFQNANFGLFMHFGLYSLLGQGEWIQLHQKIPVAEYAQLQEQFNPVNFDPDFITDLAAEAGMRYINITSKHHDGFALWPTEQNDFHIGNTPYGKDLIGQLSEACNEKGLGLFLYYSYAADWKHPYFYPRSAGWKNARPDYAEPQPEYLYEKEEDFQKYIAFAHAQIEELLTHYQPLAGIWLDPIMGYYSRPDLFPIDDTYALIRSRSPYALISFKQGASGQEDFSAPERSGGARVGDQFEVAQQAYEANKNKPKEICDTMQPHLKGIAGGATWGYNKNLDGKHLTPDQVLEKLTAAQNMDANLLLNVGPKPDGSFPQEDVTTLREVGRSMKTKG